jgi:hypothetical protein
MNDIDGTSPVDVIGFIADQDHIAQARSAAEKLCKGRRGDGWTHGVNLFEQTPAMDPRLARPYLLMVAADRERCRLAAPVVLVVENLEGLLAAVGCYADNVVGRGMWLKFVDEATGARINPLLSNCAEDGKVTEFAPSGAVREFRNGVLVQ